MVRRLRMVPALLIVASAASLMTPAWALPPKLGRPKTGEVPQTALPEPGAPVNGLQALLTIQQSAVPQGQAVGLELDLRNVSTAPLSLYRHVSAVLGTPGCVEFKVQRADGGIVRITQAMDEHAPPTPDAYVPLEPGGSLKASFNLPVRWDDPPLQPGRYELLLVVTFSDEGLQAGVQDAWAGTVVSNPAHVEITAPTASHAETTAPQPGEPVKGLQLVLRADQARYGLGDPIVVTRELRNVSEQPIVLCSAGGVHMEYTMVAPRRTEPRTLIGDVPGGLPCPAGRLVRILPGSREVEPLHLEAYEFGVPNEPGTWQIVVEKSYGRTEPGQEVWTGVLTSNPLTINVVAAD